MLSYGSDREGGFGGVLRSAMGAEFAAKGANVQLGPGLNVARVPHNGRNFGRCMHAKRKVTLFSPLFSQST
jgi:beta-glucosidase